MKLALIVCGLFAVGCGDGAPTPQSTTDSGTDANADSSQSAFCMAESARASACGEPFDAADCSSLETCYRSILRAKEADAVPACVSARACGVTVQSCLDEAAKKHEGEPSVVSYAEACAAKDAACGGGLAATVCTSEFALLTDALRTRAQDCLTRACELVPECYQSALQSAGCVR
jgi:hypothetical protein